MYQVKVYTYRISNKISDEADRVLNFSTMADAQDSYMSEVKSCKDLTDKFWIVELCITSEIESSTFIADTNDE
jgi:hypothetical protein